MELSQIVVGKMIELSRLVLKVCWTETRRTAGDLDLDLELAKTFFPEGYELYALSQ